MSTQAYVARRSFTYGGRGEEMNLSRGQLVNLQGLINDEKLIRLGYLSQASPRATVVGCGKCGAQFVTDEALASHGRDQHSALPKLTPKEEDERADRRIAHEDEVAPLHLENSAASRGVKPGTPIEATTTRTTKSAAKKKRGSVSTAN